MKVKLKKLSSLAVIPQYAKNGDAGMDLVAISKEKKAGGIVTYDTGLAIEIPEGYVGLIFPRSSIHKYELSLANSIGVVDSGYRGSIIVKFRNTDWTEENNVTYDVGNKIAQLIIIPIPYIDFEVVEELSQSERAEGGFGSSGL